MNFVAVLFYTQFQMSNAVSQLFPCQYSKTGLLECDLPQHLLEKIFLLKLYCYTPFTLRESLEYTLSCHRDRLLSDSVISLTNIDGVSLIPSISLGLASRRLNPEINCIIDQYLLGVIYSFEF